MKLLSHVQPTKFLGVQHTHLITRGIPRHIAKLITCGILGCTAIMQPSHVLCTRRVPGYGVTFAHVLTHLPNPRALFKKAMVGKDVVSKLEYSVKKIRESEALLVRQCTSHLGEYGLTLWVVSILTYAQELHSFSLSAVSHACHVVRVQVQFAS